VRKSNSGLALGISNSECVALMATKTRAKQSHTKPQFQSCRSHSNLACALIDYSVVSVLRKLHLC